MEESDVNESTEDQVSAGPEQSDVAEGSPEHAVQVGASEGTEVDTADLVCTVHGGELRQAGGKYRWICDRVQEPGSCVAGLRS